MTLKSAFRPLRSRFVFPTVRSAIAALNARTKARGYGLSVVHFSVQVDHIHLIVEASDRAALLRGVRGLAISLARRVNRLVSRRGRVFADRWHGRALETPRAVRHALVYVLANFKKHERARSAPLDRFSSAPYFRDFAGCDALHAADAPGALQTGPPVLPARTWLLRAGWLRHGPISVHEAPRG